MKKTYYIGVLNHGSKEQEFAFEKDKDFVYIAQGKSNSAIPHDIIYCICDLLEQNDGEIDYFAFECKFTNKTIKYEVSTELRMLSIRMAKDILEISQDQWHLFLHLFLDLEVCKC